MCFRHYKVLSKEHISTDKCNKINHNHRCALSILRYYGSNKEHKANLGVCTSFHQLPLVGGLEYRGLGIKMCAAV